MNILQTTKLSLKKVKFNKGKSLFVILPISLLIALIVIASSEAQNLLSVAHNSVFSSIDAQNLVLEVNKSSTQQGGPGSFSTTTTDDGYTSTDTDAIATIANVDKTSLVSDIPISNIKSTDLFDGKTISLSSVAGLDEVYSSIYTDKSFTYTEGNAIPIILNANDFTVTTENWNGSTELVVNFTRGSENGGQAMTRLETTSAVSYTKDDLIGKIITINFGGLDDIQDYTQTPTSAGFKYVKKTEAEINSAISTRKDAISTYWDYEKISTQLTYKFVVVGIIEGADKTKTYIPETFAQKLMQDYLTNETSARNSTAIPSTDWNSTYTGLVYDGVILKSDTVNSLFAGIRKQVSGQIENQFTRINDENSAFVGTFRAPPQLDAGSISISFGGTSTGYNIPGLVYAKDRTTSEVTGEYSSFDFTSALPLESTTILVKINSTSNRTNVIAGLNAAGYTYQDSSKIQEFQKLETYLSTAVSIGSVIFMVISALFILLNMVKFVSESKKEIGIFRAIGATKMKIRLIILTQSIVYILISIAVGVVLGTAVIVGISSFIVTYAQSFINSAVGGLLTLTGSISQADFLNFDIKLIGIYTLVLILVTLIITLWPAEQAAKVSPVVAIKSE